MKRSRVLLIGLAIVQIAACGRTEQTFRYTFPEARTPAWSLELVDRTGLVAGLGPALFDPDPQHVVANVASRNDLLVVSWIGGACYRSGDGTFARTGQTFELDIRIDDATGCDDIGIPIAFAIRFTQPISADQIQFSFRTQ